jgi:hypothetical protein
MNLAAVVTAQQICSEGILRFELSTALWALVPTATTRDAGMKRSNSVTNTSRTDASISNHFVRSGRRRNLLRRRIANLDQACFVKLDEKPNDVLLAALRVDVVLRGDGLAELRDRVRRLQPIPNQGSDLIEAEVGTLVEVEDYSFAIKSRRKMRIVSYDDHVRRDLNG